MDKFIKNSEFMGEVFDNQSEAKQAGEIGDAILAARSLRLTDIAVEMAGETDASYKRIQRFLKAVDPRAVLWRLFREEAEFVIGDPTEIERPQADGICRNAQGWENERVLGDGLRDAVSWASNSMRIDHLFFQDDCPTSRFAQPESFSDICSPERYVRGTTLGAGSRI